jgi:2-iminobutanoate/2-iminopropanoate deaminase
MIDYPSGPDMPRSPLPFSPVTRVGDLLFVSGQASVDRSGAIVTDNFEGEMRRSLDNLSTILSAAGSDLSHVVQTRNYVREDSDLAAFNRIYREYFMEPFPSRTTITNCLPPTLKYEIECIAVVKPDRAATPIEG